MKKSKEKIETYHLHKDEPQKLQFAIHTLQDYLKNNLGHADTPHTHSYYQIIWFTTGKGKHSVDFRSFDVLPNTVFFIAKDQIHFFDGNLNYEGLLIHFNDFFLVDEKNDLDLLLNYSLFNTFQTAPFCKLDNENKGHFASLVAQMQTELHMSDRIGHKDYLKHLLKLLLISLQRLNDSAGKQRLSLSKQSNIVFLKFRRELETHFKEVHTVKEYAAILNVSVKSLSNYTKELSSKTPLELINDRIILEARRLLSHTQLNSNEVAYSLGFNDPSYFVKFIKKHTSKSPSELRKAFS